MPRKPLNDEPTVTPAGKTIGRPRKQPPPGAAVRIADLAAIGHSVVGIAAALEASKETLARWLDEDPALKEAFEAGRERERQALHGVLYRLATEHNDKIAAMFLLKARHGYREGEPVESSTGPRVVINLPGAMPLGAFVSVENDADGRVQRVPNPAALAAARG